MREIRAWDPDLEDNGFLNTPQMKRKVLVLIEDAE
jgi:hypothetical protein